MKRILLASTVCIALGFGAVPAWAVIPVEDLPALAGQAKALLQDLNQFKQSYQMLTSQYQGIMSTVNALSHPNQAMGIAKNLLNQQMQSPGSAPSNVPGMSFGSTLSSGAQQFLNQNRVYTPQGTDFASTEMQRQAQGTANIQAEVQAGMDRSQERIASINELQSCIDAQPDIQAVAALQTRVQTEQLFLTNETNNVNRLALLQQVGAQVTQQRAEQHHAKDANDWGTRAWDASNN